MSTSPKVPRLGLSFRTGTVYVDGIGFPNAETARVALRSMCLALNGMDRELERFARAYHEGVRSENSYRLWAAAEEAPPDLKLARG